MEKEINRRQFLKTAGAASILASIGFLGACSDNDDQEELPEGVTDIGNAYEIDITVDRFSSLSVDGGFVNIEEIDIMIANTDGRIVRAYDNECPFDECREDWLFIDSSFYCECCGSRYASNGERRTGPTTENLVELSATKQDDKVVVFKRDMQ